MVRYFINGLRTYEDLIQEETYLTKNFAVKIDAIIDTGYAVKYKDIIDINVYFNDFRNSRLYDRAKVNSWLCFALIFSLPVPESFS